MRKPIKGCREFFPDGVRVLDELAHLLSQQEIVQGAELRELLAKVPSKPLTLLPEIAEPS